MKEFLNSNSLSEHPKGLGRPMYQLKLNIIKFYKNFRSLRKLVYKVFVAHLVNSVNFITIEQIVFEQQTFKVLKFTESIRSQKGNNNNSIGHIYML